MFVAFAAGGEREARDGRDGRQGFAAEAERRDRFQVVERGDLAGRVARHGEREFFRRDAAAVVAHAHEADAALFEIDLDPARAASSAFSTSSFTTDRRSVRRPRPRRSG
jgi:hypothetical protein